MNDLRNIDSDLPTLRNEDLTNILLYGNQIYEDKTYQIILMHAIRYTKDSQRFDEPLFNPPLIRPITHSIVFLISTHIRCKVLFDQVFNFC